MYPNTYTVTEIMRKPYDNLSSLIIASAKQILTFYRDQKLRICFAGAIILYPIRLGVQ